MKNLNTSELVAVVGGTTRLNDQITAQLTALTSSIKDVATNNNNTSSSPFMLIAMMMAMRNQAGPTVVAGGPPPAFGPAYGPAPGPVINIHTRFRRW